VAALVIGLGCKKKTPAVDPAPPTQNASARTLFENNCARCHAIPGSTLPADGGKGRGNKGPDLSREGADSAHTVDWISAHIRNPKAHKAESRMPSFEGKLQPAEIQALAEFLAAMKG
jgi:mono/diheme cytochrome c family protein